MFKVYCVCMIKLLIQLLFILMIICFENILVNIHLLIINSLLINSDFCKTYARQTRYIWVFSMTKMQGGHICSNIYTTKDAFTLYALHRRPFRYVQIIAKDKKTEYALFDILMKTNQCPWPDI